MRKSMKLNYYKGGVKLHGALKGGGGVGGVVV